MPSGLRETLDVLDALIADGEAAGLGTRYDAEIVAALKELQAYRRGEFLCSRCRTQLHVEQPDVEF
ncbi:MAG TPA: hypothetical protein VLW26_03040 [Steroidobacteraceae bacterium]|nr:hypothetical protein [Steroidobacteraceae bacterium]